MTDNLTGHILNVLEGVDRLGHPYLKVIRFSTGGDMTRHTNELDSLWQALNNSAAAHQAGVADWEEFRADGMAILCRVVRHTREWGVARLPTNIREPVHELEDVLGQNRTDFGPDVGVTQGAPYNGVGY